MNKITWALGFPQIWYATYRLKQRRKKENWSDLRYYQAMYSLPCLTHEFERDKFAKFRDRITAEVVKDKAKGRILDLATGRGYQARNIWDHGYRNVYACDVVEQRISQARQFNADTGIEFLVSNMRQTSFPDAFFDAITISVALHDLTAAEVEAIPHECNRIIKSGGRFVIMEPKYLGDISYPLFQKIYAFAADLLDESVSMRDFVKFDLSSSLTKLGFSLLRRQTTWYGMLCLYTFEKWN